MMKCKLPKWSYLPLCILFWIALWWIAAAIFNKPLLFPTPLDTLKALGNLALTGDFYLTVLFSLVRVLLGILLAVASGVLLALLTTKSPLCHHLFSPLLALFKATPVASVIFLLLLWMGEANVPLWIAFMMALPILWSNVREGLLQTDKQLLEMAKIFGVPDTRVLFKLRLPSLIPYFLSACRSAIALAWKAGIAAEVICTPKNSIGAAIYNDKIAFDYDKIFARTIIVIFISILFEQGMLAIVGKAQRAFITKKEETKDD